jgi:hypothetical protein
MANQVIVTNTGNVQVALTPPPNVQVQISRAAIGTVSNVPTANFANYAANVTSSSQPNITSLGTLSNLSVSGNSTVNNLVVTGNLSVGNLIANNANYANFANIANIANVANSVAVANVVGIGNIATINLDGNVANLLTGNGTFVAIPTVSANANYANFAGEAFNVNASNITGTVANANYAANAGNATIANSANSVTLANVSGAGNIASLNLDGNASNILYGNGIFATTPIISNVANANYANFAGEAFNVNASNITGNVANANYSAYAGEANTANLATFATTANAVAGANVSGEVANANFASYANIAASANSVSLANVVGIGNIANINLDGSSSNVLFGNGIFAPESTSIANANYANFAGTLINGTSNITIPTANGNVNIGSNGVANIVSVLANGVTFITPPTTVNGALTIDSYGNPAGDVHRINSRRARGNATTPLSVNNNDATMRLLTFGHNGTAYQLNSTASIRGLVDNSYTANGANIPLGWSIQVNDTNGGTNNQARTHNFYANGNVSLNNVIFADGGGLSNIVGANVTGTVANATYAVDSGTAAVANSVAVANVVGIGNIATLNLDGNASNVLLGNGVFSSVPATIPTSIANGTSNITIPTASSNILISTAGNANIVDIHAVGTFNLKPPAQGPLNALRIDTYGRSGNVGAQRINSTRYRGNATAPLSVQPGDNTMELLTVGYNGTIIQTSSIARIQSIVDSSYTANGANIPLGWQVQVNDTNGGINNQSKTHNFYANGATALAGSLSATGNITGANLITGNITANGGTYSFSNGTGGRTSIAITGDKTTNSGVSIDNAQFSVTMSNVDATTGFSPFRFTQYAPTNNQFSSMFMYRARGDDFFTQTPAVAGDNVVRIVPSINSNNTFASIGGFLSDVNYNDNAGNTAGLTTISAVGSGTTGYLNSIIALDAYITGANNFQANSVSIFNGGNLDVGSGNAYIYANGYINTTNEIDYLRTFGSFTSNATQTNGNVGNAVYMTLNNDEGSNGVSIVSSSQITVARTGRYNLQFSAQLEKTDSGTDQIEIWLTKNGSAVANSATQFELKGNGAKDVAAWNWVDNVTTANTYYQIAWGSSDANAQLTAIPSANTLSGVAIPSLIVTVVPVGA